MLDLYIVSVCEDVKGVAILTLGSAFYVDKQLMLLFV